MIGGSVGVYFAFPREVTVGLIALLSCPGPRGAGAALECWAARKG
ncbi:hypothetical protein [Gemmobacter nectariphilus]|nr:hypothetical protein [Gemmobacter nectariphilus]